MARTATITAVTEAIIELESQGYDTRIKDIIFVTGLSRSVFSKPHIRKILVEYGVVEPGNAEPSTETEAARQDIKTILAEKDGYIERLLFINEQLQHEIELLRGKVHLLKHKSMLDCDDSF